jgi:hypothetical protein
MPVGCGWAVGIPGKPVPCGRSILMTTKWLTFGQAGCWSPSGSVVAARRRRAKCLGEWWDRGWAIEAEIFGAVPFPRRRGGTDDAPGTSPGRRLRGRRRLMPSTRCAGPAAAVDTRTDHVPVDRHAVFIHRARRRWLAPVASGCVRPHDSGSRSGQAVWRQLTADPVLWAGRRTPPDATCRGRPSTRWPALSRVPVRFPSGGCLTVAPLGWLVPAVVALAVLTFPNGCMSRWYRRAIIPMYRRSVAGRPSSDERRAMGWRFS